VISAADILHAKVLIVDDLEANVRLLQRMLAGAGYDRVASTTDPKAVCEMHRANNYDLILLDLQMPGMDGFQVMEGLKEIETGSYLPVLVITAQPAHMLRALKAGAKDFVGKPFDIAEVLLRVNNMLEVRLLHSALSNANDVLEQRVLERTAGLRKSYTETVYVMTRAAEHKDEDTGTHVQRMSEYCSEMARGLGLAASTVDEIFFASPMHDVGKIGIPDHILLKRGVLVEEEWAVMRAHTTMGAKILGSSDSPYLRMGAEIALNHHERWNGGGYPAGRCGEDIPLAARIVNLCDVYDALRSARPYKSAFTHERATDIITRGDGRTLPEHFDPGLLDRFVQQQFLFRDIYDAHSTPVDAAPR